MTGGVQAPPQAQRLYQILYSLGAGPRPGLPFAPKKGNSMARPSSQPPYQQGSPLQQQHYGNTTSPPVNTDVKPYNNQPMYNTGSNPQAPGTMQQQQPNVNNSEQGMYDEPPPPYMPPAEQPNMFMGAGDTKQTPTPPTADTKQTLYNTSNESGTTTTQTPYNNYSGPNNNNSGSSSTQPFASGVDGNAPAYSMNGSSAFANYQPDQSKRCRSWTHNNKPWSWQNTTMLHSNQAIYHFPLVITSLSRNEKVTDNAGGKDKLVNVLACFQPTIPRIWISSRI